MKLQSHIDKYFKEQQYYGDDSAEREKIQEHLDLLK